MLPVPIPRTFGVQEVEVAAYLNAVRDALNFLINPPVCFVTQLTTSSISTAVWTALAMDVSVVDSYGGHSNTTNPSRYTAQVAGWYLVSGASSFAANGTGLRGALPGKNSTHVPGGGQLTPTTPSSPPTNATASIPIFLNVGDYVETFGFQSSGGGLATAQGSDLTSSLSALWIHA